MCWLDFFLSLCSLTKMVSYPQLTLHSFLLWIHHLWETNRAQCNCIDCVCLWSTCMKKQTHYILDIQCIMWMHEPNTERHATYIHSVDKMCRMSIHVWVGVVGSGMIPIVFHPPLHFAWFVAFFILSAVPMSRSGTKGQKKKERKKLRQTEKKVLIKN